MLKATLRSFFAHKGRLLLSALAVVLSVAFVAGSLIFSDTASRTFDRLFATTSADVSVSPKEDDLGGGLPTGDVRTLPASVADRVRSVEGVAAAQVEATAQGVTVVGRDNEPVGLTGGAPTIATNWYDTPRNPLKLTSGELPRGPGESVVDADTAERARIGIGDTLRVIARPGTFSVRVVGIATFTTTNPGAALVLLDTATAQTKLLGSADAATLISVQAAQGVPDALLKERIAAALGSGYELRTAAEQAKSSVAELGGFLDVVKYVMLGFAGVAVLVGIFLIVNTFAMLIAQRTRELGLLRALGADRRQVRRSVLTEALLLGLVGSTLGLAAGIGLAAALIWLMGLFGMKLSASDMVLGRGTFVAAYAVGVGVTFVAAYLPARRASKVSPMAALAEAEVAGQGRPLRIRALVGGVLAAGGAAAFTGCALSADTATASLLLGLGVVLTLIATVVAGPLLVRPVIRVLGAAFPRVYGSVGRMSQRNALRNPRRTGATASALMVGLALVAGLSVASASMTKSLDRQIDRTLGADFVVQSGSFLPFPPEVAEKVRKVGAVGTVVRQRFVPVRLSLPDGKRVKSTAAGYDPQLDEVARVRYAQGNTAAALAAGSMGMDRKFAEKHGVRAGTVVPVEFPGGRRAALRVAAISDQDAPSGGGFEGGLFMGMGTAQRYFPGGQESALYVNAADGVAAPALRTALERALDPYPQVNVQDRADYKELVRQQVAVLLYLVYGLLGLAIVIAVLGVVNTLALSVVERTREIGLLRAIGLSRVQLRRMIRLESIVIAVFGAVLGLVLGLVWGVAMSRVLALQGMTAFAVPWSTVVAVVVGSVVVGLVAAVLPALRASRMNVLTAIAHE
ncbi:ABC transporter permease [Streptomyces sp. NPDC021093]|uniref:ABC transporter permease n=1 Tax=Streptomyces sp. NPDC021093 TaxID=3365112 RepID=UPI0037B7116E